MGGVSEDILDELRFEDSLCRRAADEIEALRVKVLKLYSEILRLEIRLMRDEGMP